MQSDYFEQVIRADAILTDSYVASTVIGLSTPNENRILLETQNQLVLLIDFTIGSLTSGEIKIEFSPDDSDYYQETNSSAPTSGVVTDTVIEHTYEATGKFRIAIPIKDRYIKVSAKGTGTVTDSSMKITAITGVV